MLSLSMKKLTVTIYFTITVLLGNGGVSWSAGLSHANSNKKLLELETERPIQYPSFGITNYPSEIHGGYGATWGITQSSDGKMYFANSYGVLVFDGVDWKTLLTKNNRAARSITIDSARNVIVGTKGDMGVMSGDFKNKIMYRSIISDVDRKKLEPDTVFEVLPLGSKKYFYRTSRGIYFFEDGRMKKINTPKNFRFGVSHLIDGQIFIYVVKRGLFKLVNGELSIIKGTENFKTKKQTIYGVFKESDGLIIVTRRSGIYRLKSGLLKRFDYTNELINKTTIYRVISLRSGGYALATYDGVFILNANLGIEQHISRNVDLITNNVRSLYEDIEGNLWAGTNDGISKIKLKSGLRFFDKTIANINASINRISFFNGKIYLATETGVRVSKIDSKSLRQFFTPILEDKIKSQVWDLLSNREELFLGSNYGIGVLNKEGVYNQFIDRTYTGSVYKIKKSKIFKDKILIGTKKGLALIDPTKKNEIQFLKIDKGKIWNFYELPKSNEIWTYIKGKGVYRIKIDRLDKLEKIQFSVKKYGDSEGLPGHIWNPFEFNNEILFGTVTGTYRFDKISEKFSIDQRFSKIPNYKMKKIIFSAMAPNEKYWIAILDRSKGFRNIEFYQISRNFKLSKLELNELKHYSKIKFDFYRNYALLSGSRGIAIFPIDIDLPASKGRVIINEIVVQKSGIYGGAPFKKYSGKRLSLKNKFLYSERKIKFKFSGTDFTNERKNLFRSKLLNFDNYSEFSKNREVTYNNLPPGHYTFIVEGLNANRQNLLPFQYKFEIESPWWESAYFYVAEVLFFLVLLFFTVLVKQNTRVEKLATALTFVVIIIIFEYVNLTLDPLILEISGGVPVFTLVSKVILGMMLQPTERITSRSLDWCSQKFSRNTVS